MIVVGADGSETSARAVAVALGAARRQRCQLSAVHVVTRSLLTGLAREMAGEVDRAGEEMAAEMRVDRMARIGHQEQMTTTARAIRRESRRSRRPPEPGSQRPVSLTSAPRLIIDSSRSPAGPPTATATVMGTVATPSRARTPTPATEPARVPLHRLPGDSGDRCGPRKRGP